MLRKRAWDVMREQFSLLTDDATLSDGMVAVRRTLKEQPDNDLLVVVDGLGRLSGAVGIREMLRAIQGCVLQDERLRNVEGTDWDRAYGEACQSCGAMPIKGLMDPEPLVVRPGDPLLHVVQELVEKNSRWAVACEGGKPIGVVLVGEAFREVARGMPPLAVPASGPAPKEPR